MVNELQACPVVILNCWNETNIHPNTIQFFIFLISQVNFFINYQRLNGQ